MDERMEAFKAWAPEASQWTDWAKPVLFAQKVHGHPKIKERSAEWAEPAERNVMIIVDLPGLQGLEEGLALAKRGYRPVPLYNGVPENAASSLVDSMSIAVALQKGSDLILAIDISKDAPPAFLLDENRMNGGKSPGKYDNRWSVFPQDMPSASFLKAHGIRKIVVRAKLIQNDLKHVLLRYAEGGIEIAQCENGSDVRTISVHKPSGFRRAWYRFGVIAGLTRNATGGFGGLTPEEVQGSSGGYYHYG